MESANFASSIQRQLNTFRNTLAPPGLKKHQSKIGRHTVKLQDVFEDREIEFAYYLCRPSKDVSADIDSEEKLSAFVLLPRQSGPRLRGAIFQS